MTIHPGLLQYLVALGFLQSLPESAPGLLYVCSLLLSLTRTPVIGFRACLGHPGGSHLEILNLATPTKMLFKKNTVTHTDSRA